jgi:putative flippase GtrA
VKADRNRLAWPFAHLLATPVAKFVVVGGIGFLVDAAILTLLAETTRLGLIVPRLVSFPAALSVTWYLNRVWTFQRARDQKAVSQYSRYALVQIAGSLLNLVVYIAAIGHGPTWFRGVVIVPLAIASGVAMFFNFMGAKHWAFSPSRTHRR